MRDKLYTLGFTLALTAVCGLLVAGFDAAVSGRKAELALAARQRVVLQLAGVAGVETWAAPELAAAFAARIASAAARDPDGRERAWFEVIGAGRRRAIIPFAGSGFWDVIRGYVALDLPGSPAGTGLTGQWAVASPPAAAPAVSAVTAPTLVGLEFTEHAETPGLGGRITEPVFKARFAGMVLGAPDGEGRWLRLVAEGSARGGTTVDAITGATETSRAVERLLNRTFTRYLAVLAATPAGGRP